MSRKTRVMDMSRKCLGHVPEESWTCLGSVSDMSRKCLGNVSEASRKCLGSVPDMSRKRLGNVSEASRTCLGSVADMCLSWSMLHALGHYSSPVKRPLPCVRIVRRLLGTRGDAVGHIFISVVFSCRWCVDGGASIIVLMAVHRSC